MRENFTCFVGETKKNHFANVRADDAVIRVRVGSVNVHGDVSGSTELINVAIKMNKTLYGSVALGTTTKKLLKTSDGDRRMYMHTACPSSRPGPGCVPDAHQLPPGSLEDLAFGIGGHG